MYTFPERVKFMTLPEDVYVVCDMYVGNQFVYSSV